MGKLGVAAVLVLFAAGCASNSEEDLKPLPPSGPRAGLFISPMGEPFHGAAGADLIGQWFAGADADRDGALTQDEMTRDGARFFHTLDTDRSGEITPPEMVRYETEIAPEIQLSSQGGARGGRGRPPIEGRPDETPAPASGDAPRRGPGGAGVDRLPQGAGRYGLLDLPQPVAAADVDINRAVSAEEFNAAAVERFQLLDRDHDGRITRQELEPLPPPVKR